MSIKLKDIDGLMVEKEIDVRCGCDGFNTALSLMSEKSICLNREKLAELIYNTWWANHKGEWNKEIGDLKECIYQLADAIIANLGNILEAK